MRLAAASGRARSGWQVAGQLVDLAGGWPDMAARATGPVPAEPAVGNNRGR